MGSHLSLFLFYIPLGELFWVSIYWRFLLIFDPRDFLSPGGCTQRSGTLMGSPLILFLFYIILRRVDLTQCYPYGVPIESLSLLYPP